MKPDRKKRALVVNEEKRRGRGRGKNMEEEEEERKGGSEDPG